MLRFEKSFLAPESANDYTHDELEDYKNLYEEYYSSLEADFLDVIKKNHKKFGFSFDTRSQYDKFVEMLVDLAVSRETEIEVFNS